ncbi:MAG TPA: flagellar motor switch protein FliM [Vicinamibacterales bacterium]|nr:flagellar motor switch protein FliM [Vicinamibacterales bacterium]
MSKILSQDEIDALLNSSAVIDRSGAVRTSDAALADTVIYNFRRPDRVSKDTIRSLHFLHDRFARNLATSLSAYLRTVTDLTIISVEQFSYSEFLMSLPDPTAFYAIALQPYDNLGALEINPSVAFTIIDRMLGGNGQAPAPNRALTEIEQNVVDAVVKVILENLTEVWRPIVDLVFRIQGRETRPQMLQVASPNEGVVLLVFDIKVGDTRGMLNLCVPASVIEMAGSGFSQGWRHTQRGPTVIDRKRLLENLRRVPMTTMASLGSSIPGADLVALKSGDVLALATQLKQPVEISVGRRHKFNGRLVLREGQAAVVVEEFVGWRPAPQPAAAGAEKEA